MGKAEKVVPIQRIREYGMSEHSARCLSAAPNRESQEINATLEPCVGCTENFRSLLKIGGRGRMPTWRPRSKVG
jgi:hypothetical protein